MESSRDLMLTRACRGDEGLQASPGQAAAAMPASFAGIQSPEQKPQQQRKGDSSQRDSRHAQCEQQQQRIVMDQRGLITFGTVGDVFDVTTLGSDDSPEQPRDGEVITEDLERVETKGEEVAGGESLGSGGGIVHQKEIAKGEKKGEVEVVEIAKGEKEGEVEVVEIAKGEKGGEVEVVEIGGGSQWEGLIPLGKERKLLGSWCADADAAARKRLMQAPAAINQTENPGLMSARTEPRRTTNALATRAPLGSKNRATPVTTKQPIQSFTGRNVPADPHQSRRKASHVAQTRSPPTPAPEVSRVRTTCQVRSVDVYPGYTPPPPTVMMTTTSSLTLKWQHVPDEDNDFVYTYTLEMLKDGAWTSVYNGHGLWCEIRALAPGSEYSFRVRAHTVLDSSARSAALVARTLATPPGAAVQAMNELATSDKAMSEMSAAPPSTPPTAKVKSPKKPKVKAKKEATGLTPRSLKEQEIQAWRWTTSILCATIVAAGVVTIGLVSLF